MRWARTPPGRPTRQRRRGVRAQGRRELRASSFGVDCLQMTEPHEDSWETPWEAEQDFDRDEVLRLARHLAEQRQRQRAEDLAEIEELKRTLRERAADVAAREAEVEQRRVELEQREAAIRGERHRRLRLHRPEPPQRTPA